MRVGDTFYCDYQASTPVDPRVLEQMLPFFFENFANPHSNDHILGWKANQEIEIARHGISTLINADPDEIVFTSGATEANNMVFHGICPALEGGKRNTILISSIEHKCVKAAAYALSERGYSVNEVPVTREGIVDLEALDDLLDDTVLLVSVMAVNNEVGSIQPISKISDACKNVGTFFHCDAAQALTSIPLDMHETEIDFLSLSSHKAYGPKGIGALFIKRSLKNRLRPLILGGQQEDGLRSGTLSTPNAVGFGAACKILSKEGASDQAHTRVCRDDFFQNLKELIPDIKLNGPVFGFRHPANLNVEFPDADAKSMLAMLQPSIAASTGSACNSGMPEPSYVLRAMGLSSANADSSIRFSFGRFTKQSDIPDAVQKIASCYENSRI